ncbi:MAG: Ig-like domain-containing protein [Gammaproteobacteria bacterium]|nr:Ig-like domain-containing protein [Gammaproteobacteria bacterium]
MRSLKIASQDTSFTLRIGQTLQLNAVANYSDNSNKVLTTSVSWKSSNDKVVAVNQLGEIKALSSGSAEISVVVPGTNNRFRDKVKYSVSPTLKRIEILTPDEALLEESTIRMHAVGHYSNNTTADISEVVAWTSDFPELATFEEGNVLRGLQLGEARVRATYEKHVGELSLDIEPLYERIELKIERNIYRKNEQFNALVIAHRIDGTSLDITNYSAFEIENESENSNNVIIADEGDNNHFYAINAGSTKVRALFKGRLSERTIIVQREFNLYVNETRNNRIELLWDHEAGETYTLFWDTQKNMVSKTAIEDIPLGQYVHENVVDSKVYYYQVVSSDGIETPVTKVVPFKNQWRQPFNLEKGNMRPAVATVGLESFVIGGQSQNVTGNPLTSAQISSLQLPYRTINSYSSLTSGLRDAVACSHDNIIHVFGGSTEQATSQAFGEMLSPLANNNIQRFDTSTLTWLQAYSMEISATSRACAVLGDTIYISGGNNETTTLANFSAYATSDGTISARTPMPQARSGHTLLAIDNKIYAVGGRHFDVVWNFYTDVSSYDPDSNQWNKIGDLATPRSDAGVTVVNGLIYVFGGRNENGALVNGEVFNPVDGTSTSLPDLPRHRYGHVALMKDNVVYLLGGGRSENALYQDVEQFNLENQQWLIKSEIPYLNDGVQLYESASTENKLVVFARYGSSTGFEDHIDIYDSKKNSWSTGPRNLTSRVFMATTSHNNKIYAIGGKTSNGNDAKDTVEIYDSESNSWHFAEPLPAERKFAAACTLDGKIYVTGGRDSNNIVHASVFRFNPIDNSWAELSPMKLPRFNHRCVALQGRIYVVGGEALISNQVNLSASMELYEPLGDFWQTGASLRIPRTGFSMEMINNNLYVFGGRVKTSGNDAFTDTIAVYSPYARKWNDGANPNPQPEDNFFPFRTPISFTKERLHPHAHFIGNELFLFGGQEYNSADINILH